MNQSKDQNFAEPTRASKPLIKSMKKVRSPPPLLLRLTASFSLKISVLTVFCVI